MEFSKAYEIALRVKAQLAPHCDRIEIAGSIRRKKPEVKDIEIVAIPKPWGTGLFLDGVAEVVSQWEKVKGDVENNTECKYTQRVLPEGIKLDLFFCVPENWGLIYALRTGPADYSHHVLANGWVIRGYRSHEGFLYNAGKRYDVREEEDLYKRIALPFELPEHRQWPQVKKEITKPNPAHLDRIMNWNYNK
jgi:DNA polymerase/3'-5' exonuclease PolX